MKSTKKLKKSTKGSNKIKNFRNFIVLYFTTKRILFLTIGSLCVGILLGFLVCLLLLVTHNAPAKKPQVFTYWLSLHRKSGVELLYKGQPGEEKKSVLVKSFHVKTGMEGRPTPLPTLYGRKYWVITHTYDTSENIETAPYFIELNIPHSNVAPFGPAPYLECDGLAFTSLASSSARGEQCNWELPGPFGLHGVNGDQTRLDSDNPGSSGCIRHTDEDITFLYNIINPKEHIRYYIEDK